MTIKVHIHGLVTSKPLVEKYKEKAYHDPRQIQKLRNECFLFDNIVLEDSKKYRRIDIDYL